MGFENRILVIGGTGKTGRRVVSQLKARGALVRVGSRSSEPSFDWENPETWTAALQDVHSVYITYQPDLAVPGADDAIRAFTQLAVAKGIQRLVLLSGRGEVEAQACEQIVQDSGVQWTILRASWFYQNFSESYLLEPILNNQVVLPVGNVPEPFIDAEDIAAVAVAALTENGHAGQIYELTGPRMLTFAEAVQEIAEVSKRNIHFVQISPDQYKSALEEQQVPVEYIWLLNYLFTTVLDGRNAHLTDGVQRALGRKPIDFTDFAKRTAATGVWVSQ